MADKGRTIRVPVHVGERIRKMLRVRGDLLPHLGREPTDGELAGELGWDVGELKFVKSAVPDATSLNRRLSPDGDGLELGELIEDARAPDPAGEAVQGLAMARFEEAVGGLPERHRYVLVRRYGLEEGDTATLARLSGELGVSRERVRRSSARQSRSWAATASSCAPLSRRPGHLWRL